MKPALFGLLLCAASAAGGCSKPQSPPELTLPSLPKDTPIRLGTEFGGALELLGARLSPAQGLKPGSRVELTLYWQKRAPVARGYRLFTHLLDGAGERVLNLDAVGELRKERAGKALLPPSSWEEGKVYVDRQSFSLPLALRTDSFSVVTGLYRDRQRLGVTRGSHDADRALVLTSTVSRPVNQTGVPLLWVPRRRPHMPIVIDGKLDEQAWSIAASTGPLVNAATGEPPGGDDVAGSVKLTYDDERLYVGFDVLDHDVRGGFDPDQQDPPLWTRDAVELMIDPDGDGDGVDYYEIQVNPQNLVFDSRFDSYNSPKQEPNGPFGHQEWSARLQSAVTVHGTLDDAREDDGYVVEIAIPWSSFEKAERVPPNPHDVWRMNFYAVQDNAGSAWSPILGQGNFHRASRFGRVRFAK